MVSYKSLKCKSKFKKLDGYNYEQRFFYFFADCGNLVFIHRRLRDDVGQGTSGQELHDDPQLPAVAKALDEVYQVWMVQLFHHLRNKNKWGMNNFESNRKYKSEL
jgi:hypothetical protein